MRASTHMSDKHPKRKAVAGFVGGGLKMFIGAFQETHLGQPADSWFFFGHRPMLTAMTFGILHALACVVFTATVVVDRKALSEKEDDEMSDSSSSSA